MRNPRINLTLAPDQRLMLQRYSEVYGISQSQIGQLALMAFFAAHPLSTQLPIYQLPTTPSFDSVNDLLSFLEAQGGTRRSLSGG